jgi:hypothetical protein
MNYIWSQFSNRLHFLCTIDIVVNTDSTHYLLVFMLVIFTCAIDMSEIVRTGNICGGSRTQSYRRLYNEGGWCWFWVQQSDDKLHDLHLLLYIFSGNCVAVLHVVVVSLLRFFKLFSCWNKQLPHKKNFVFGCVCVWMIWKILGLDICANTLVGDNMHRGISGGQKKRVTTGTSSLLSSS